MSFNTITNTIGGTSVFNAAGPGRYIWASSTFGGPRNYYQISPGSRNAKTKQTSASVTRIFELDVTVGSASERHTAQVTLQIQTTDRVTTDTVDLMISQISEFVTPDTLNRLLSGES